VSDVRNVIIIGSGPAGYTAAIYASRANLAPLMFEGSVTAGGDLMDALRKQAQRFGTEIVTDDVIEVDLTGDVKVVKAGDDSVHRARSVIIATGSAYRELGLPNEKRLSGRGISWCATCDGFFFRGQDIVVVGGGDSAMEEATFLTRFATTVTVVHRRDQLRASKIMQQRAFSHPKIKFVWDSEVVDILGDEKVSGVRIRNRRTGAESTLDATGLFVAIGHEPRTELLAGQVDLDEAGYVKVVHPTTQTNLPGVFACGDVVDHIYRQAVTAAGTGCAAALDAERYLAALEGHPETAQTADALSAGTVEDAGTPAPPPDRPELASTSR
jgi:thioredoxin reductase (NADPH)